MHKHRFIKEGEEWYVDLPDYIDQGGHKGDLQMVQGADTMLEMIAGDEKEVILWMDRIYFVGADKMTMTERCDPSVGGANYNLYQYQGEVVDQNLWLCSVTEFVFGDLPEEIFLKKVS